MTRWLVAGWLTMQPVDLATGFNKKKRSPQTKLIVVGYIMWPGALRLAGYNAG